MSLRDWEDGSGFVIIPPVEEEKEPEDADNGE